MPKVKYERVTTPAGDKVARLFKRSTEGSSAQSWVFRYTLCGLTVERGLGSCIGDRALSTASAIRLAAKYSGILADKRDPFGETVTQRTFRSVVEELVATMTTNLKGWKKDRQGRSLTAIEYQRMIDTDAPRLARLQFNHPAIEAEVEKALKPFWPSKKGNDMAARIHAVFNLAKTRKLWTADNPAQLDRLARLLGPAYDTRSQKDGGDTVHHKALPYTEVPAVSAQLTAMGGKLADCAQFMILTPGPRVSNYQQARKSHIDLKARTWTIPGQGVTGESMKSGAEHTCYLNDAAMAIVERYWNEEGDYLFASDSRDENGSVKPVSDTAISDKLMKPAKRGGLDLRGRCTPHGFRSSFGEMVTRVYPEYKAVADAMLAHAEGKVTKAYFREQPVEVMQLLSQAWGDHCTGSKVVAFVPRAKVA